MPRCRTERWKYFRVETTRGCLSCWLSTASSRGPDLEMSDSMILMATEVPNQVLRQGGGQAEQRR